MSLYTGWVKLAPSLSLFPKPIDMKSHTRFLLLAGFILVTLSGSAQLRPGIKAGMNYGGLSGYDGGKKASIHAGLFLQCGKAQTFKIQPELVYQQVIQDYTTEVNEQIVNNTLSVGMVTLPLLFQYYPSKKIYIEAGPQLSVITGANNKGANGGKADVRRNLSNTQFGLNAGIGVELQQRLHLCIRYQAGFSDITLYDTGNDFVRVLQAGISFRFK